MLGDAGEGVERGNSELHAVVVHDIKLGEVVSYNECVSIDSSHSREVSVALKINYLRSSNKSDNRWAGRQYRMIHRIEGQIPKNCAHLNQSKPKHLEFVFLLWNR